MKLHLQRFPRFELITLCCLLTAFVMPAAGEEWTQWRGAERAAKSTETGLLQSWPESGPPLLWRASGFGAGYATMVIADGRLFTTGDLGDSQYVLAAKADDGSQLWKTKIGEAFECRFGYHGSRGTPTIDGDRVYAMSTDGLLVSLEAATGKLLWKRSLTADFGGKLMNDLWRFTESPLIDGDRLIVTPGGPQAMMVALDKNTGKEIWRSAMPAIGEQGDDGAGFASAVISEAAGVRQYVQLVGRGVIGVEAASGRFLWGYNKVANDVANIPTPIVHGDYVFASTSYDTGSALLQLSRDGKNVKAEEVYFLTPNVMQNHHGGLVLHNGYLYAGQGHNKGFPICIEMKTGKVVWGPIRNAGKGSAAVVYADGHLIYRYQSGHVVLVEATPEEYREKGVFTLPELKKESWPHPVISDGRLYLRENDNLFVYALTAERQASGLSGQK